MHFSVSDSSIIDDTNNTTRENSNPTESHGDKFKSLRLQLYYLLILDDNKSSAVVNSGSIKVSAIKNMTTATIILPVLDFFSSVDLQYQLSSVHHLKKM